MARLCRLGHCTKSAAFWGTPVVLPTSPRRQPVTPSRHQGGTASRVTCSRLDQESRRGPTNDICRWEATAAQDCGFSLPGKFDLGAGNKKNRNKECHPALWRPNFFLIGPLPGEG